MDASVASIRTLCIVRHGVEDFMSIKSKQLQDNDYIVEA